MTLPSTWPTVPVFGTYLRVDGTPNEGSVWFETSQRVVVLDENGLTIGVVPRRIIAELDATGHFTLDLPCTDAGAQPTGWTWQVYERFNSGQPVYSIEVPQALSAQGINLVQYPHAVPVPVTPPVVSYLTTADIGVTVADQVGVDNAVTTANAAATTASAAQAAAASAVVTANDASAVANAIDGKAQSALDNSNAAVTTANAASATATAAQNTANAIDGKAQSALDASAAATTTANDAKTTADGIAGTANTALTNANAAVTTANAAQSTANAALPATSNAVSASKWAAARHIAMSGDVVWDVTTDGSADATAIGTIQPQAVSVSKMAGAGSTAGQVPVSQGAAAAPAWGWTSPGFKNWLINGNFDFWQRGTTFSGIAYTADRWQCAAVGSGGAYSQQAFAANQTAVPNGPAFFLRTVVTSVAGASNSVGVTQKTEDVRLLAGKSITVSFWAKADAARPISVTSTQDFGLGGSPSPQNTLAGQKINLTTAWQYFTVTFAIPAIGANVLGTSTPGWTSVRFYFDAGASVAGNGGIGQQSGTFDIAQAQLEVGGIATPFEMRPMQVELALCQRYFEKSYDIGTAPGTSTTNNIMQAYQSGLPSATYTVNVGEAFKVTKRVVPVVTPYTTAGVSGKIRDAANSADVTPISVLVGMNKVLWGATTQTVTTLINMQGHWTADAEL